MAAPAQRRGGNYATRLASAALLGGAGIAPQTEQGPHEYWPFDRLSNRICGA